MSCTYQPTHLLYTQCVWHTDVFQVSKKRHPDSTNHLDAKLLTKYHIVRKNQYIKLWLVPFVHWILTSCDRGKGSLGIYVLGIWGVRMSVNYFSSRTLSDPWVPSELWVPLLLTLVIYLSLLSTFSLGISFFQGYSSAVLSPYSVLLNIHCRFSCWSSEENKLLTYNICVWVKQHTAPIHRSVCHPHFWKQHITVKLHRPHTRCIYLSLTIKWFLKVRSCKTI